MISFAENSFLSSFLMNILFMWANIVLIYVYFKSKMENSVIYMGKWSGEICLLLGNFFVYMHIQSANGAMCMLNVIFIKFSYC